MGTLINPFVAELCTERIIVNQVQNASRFFGLLSCVACNRGVSTSCYTCMQQLRYVPLITRAGNAVPAQFAFFQYTKVVKLLFRAYKFRRQFVYQRDIEQLMAQYIRLDPFLYFRSFAEQFRNTRILILPVPMTRSKREERGFSPAIEFAVIIGRHLRQRFALDIWLVPNLVTKKQETRAQAGRKRTDRLLALNKAFAVDIPTANALAPSLATIETVIIIVDDVYTTGATITAVSEVLQQCSALANVRNKIYSLTFAQSLRRIVS